MRNQLLFGSKAMQRSIHPQRIAIVADHASARFGGEAMLPLHYFRILRSRGLEVHLVVHARTQSELCELFPDGLDHLHFVPDSFLHRALWHVGRMLPTRIYALTLGAVSHLLTQIHARRMVRQLVRDHGVQLVHQPIPVSAREPSLMYGIGAPVVIGPLNGGMSYPPAFRRLEGPLSRVALRFARWISDLTNCLLPGKLEADAILVANSRTRRALPRGISGRVFQLVENGVDLSTWTEVERGSRPEEGIRFVFLGRLVKWKAVDLLLEAFRDVRTQLPCTLEIIGDGAMRGRLEELAHRLAIVEDVSFAGWLPQGAVAKRLRSADALVLPSLYESGGAVVLEAMASSIPVVASDWGGPADYLDESCGILVPPTTVSGFVSGLADAMLQLARSREQRETMGRAGRERAISEFDWQRKMDRILEIYREASEHFAGRPARGRRCLRQRAPDC